MQSSGGNPMNAAQLARLQQQLAHYGRGNGQQQMMNAQGMGGMGGMGNQQSQQFQQALMQQQLQQQNQGQQNNMQMRRNSSLGMNGNAAALAMMQQQQQAAAGGSQMANANMSSYWNALQNQNSQGVDTSNANSAQLAALAGMNAAGNSNQNNTANMLLGNRASQSQQQQQQQQQQQMQGMGNQQMQGMGQGNDAALLQQKIAQLQRQLQQQQQQQNPSQGQGMNMQGSANADRRNSSNNFAGMQGNQQQLYQQMQQQAANGMMGQDQQQAMGMAQQQQQQGRSNEQFANMNAMMQGQNMNSQQMQQNLRNSMNGSQQGMMQAQSRGSLNEQELLLQQQQLLRSSGMSQNMQNDSQNVQDMFANQQNMQNDLMGQRRNAMQQQQQQQQRDTSGMGGSRSGQNQMMGGFNNMGGVDMDGSVSSHRSANRQMPQQQQMNNMASMDGGNNQQQGMGNEQGNNDQGNNQRSFLDGSFAGGWQSNADLPDRRRIIFSILEVIRQMRPDTNKISQKLPHMAKSLEEHLYRSAQTKEEYLDPSTLKRRLQLIAHGLELHRTTSSGSVNSGNSNQNSNMQNDAASQQSNMNQSQAAMINNNNNNMQNMGSMNNMNNMAAMASANQNQSNSQMDMLQGLGSGMDSSMNSMSQSQNAALNSGDRSRYQEQIAAQKRRVVRQQQQRLLLLRHASKCKEGPNCTTRSCAQMMTLWRHMKKCRDKNCKTSHCLSSRCVLNHYRICRAQGNLATCEVCGPVVEQFNRQEQGGSGDDPLAGRADADLQMNQQMQFNQGNNNSNAGQQNNNNMQAMQQQQAMQQLLQQQQQALQQNQQNQSSMQGGMNQQQQQQQQAQQQQGNMSAMNNAGSMGNMQNDASQNSMSGGNQQQDQGQNAQGAQQKLQQQQQILRQLQRQQQQLLEQQQQLQERQSMMNDPNSPEAQQLQQQSVLLQQLQRRCQQQQALIQQELMLQMKALEQSGGAGQSMGNASQGSQQLTNNSQSSQRSHQSGNSGSQNQNQVQSDSIQSQMQSMSGQVDSMSGNKNMGDMGLSMPDNSSNQQDQLLQMQGDMNNQSQSVDGPSSVPDLQQSQDAPGNSMGGQLPKSMSQQLSDASEGSSSSKRQKAKPVGRGKGARGRGGKGKRLRDIADDLGSAGAAISATDATVLSKKRTADDMGGDDNEENPSKVQKSEDNDDGNDGDKRNEQNNSLTSSLPKGDVEQHLLLLHKGLHLTSRTITHKCLPIVQQLIDDPFGWVFRDAVDPVVFGLPDYFEVVKNPMHLLLVKKKLENAVYTDMASFERDVKLVFENAILYNGEESEVGQLAQTMMGVFEREYKKVCEETRKTLAPIAPNACSLCGLERRQFQLPVLYCVGMSCGMQPIKRNAAYYTSGSNQNIWCEKCFSKIRENETVVLDDGNEVKKSKLQKAIHDSLPQEAWVQCDGCKSRVHQICALTSDRLRDPNKLFYCPKCDLNHRKGPNLEPSEGSQGASELQKCEMSDFIEAGVEKSLQDAYKKKAEELGVKVDEIDKASGITIRVLSHIEKKHALRDEMYELYAKSGSPYEFPVHTKCIGLFQAIDGVDVLLFAMYVYEYGHDCPAPNRRRVYISYLDSVQFFQPAMFRTVAYQAIIAEYLRFVKKRGFHTAHIWSCPPTPGDEYVFYCHPPAQKIPKEEKLRNWYLEMLEGAKRDGIVVETTDYYDEYFSNQGENAPGGVASTPLSLPYFEGDYIPGEIENILSKLTKSEKSQLPSAHMAPKRSGSKVGTRSNPGHMFSMTEDKIMARLGKAIFNMKENLIIVRLRNKRFIAAVDRGDDVSNWPDDDASLPMVKGKDSSVLGGTTDVSIKDISYELDPTSAVSEMEVVLSRQFVDTKGPRVGTTKDADPQRDTEMFENRQLFLNYCQMNHCQFDDLRKAKHSTMLVLYQLHNLSSPKFYSSCGNCHKDITFGTRHHCNICPNFDLCNACHKGLLSRTSGKCIHNPSHSFAPIKLSDSLEAAKSQEERARSLKAYLEVLAHASTCDGPPGCKLVNCQKMKMLFVHVKTCEITHMRGCKVCHRLVSLIVVHARSCTVRGHCPLPFCDKIRERHERLRRQQQMMDDRRRQSQNNYYGAGDSHE